MGAVQENVALRGKQQLPLWPAGPLTGKSLLAWYDAERRDLPWRCDPRKAADPYLVWLSEIMLQRTTVKVVVPYFQKFVTRWPTVTALAIAPLEEVLQQWAGLGYYSRARNLKACADVVVRDYGGVFPCAEVELLKLPGIGPYTAAAISAIAFGKKATPVDSNVERVVLRLFAVRQPLPAARPKIRRLAATLTPQRQAGDFAQAMMDLGAEICTPKKPSCLVCPVQQNCAASAQNLSDVLPMKATKAARPSRYGIAFLVQREDSTVLLRQRPEVGLLGGMLEVPSTIWGEDLPVRTEAMQFAPVMASWLPVVGTVVHVFTHFRLELVVYRALVPIDASFTLWAKQERCRWVHRRDLHTQALPSLMKKVITHGFADN